jgi:hypothetical protein
MAGMSQQEVSALVAAVRGLSSCYGAVQTAAAVKLQHITAHALHPEAVAEAMVELDAIQVGTVPRRLEVLWRVTEVWQEALWNLT